MSDLDIAQVARRSGVPASTLRFYEERGLIRSIGRRMFGADGTPRIDRALLRAKADELDATIRRLAAMRDGLRHAADCRAPSHAECPHFGRIVRLAGAGRLEPPPRKPFVAESV
jgi:MerR family redox-sensitive transcriptional activator SoxR